MKIPISEKVLAYESPKYNAILDGIINKGHQVVSISGPRNCAKTFWEVLFLLTLHESVAGLVSVVCMKEYANISKTFIPTLKEISPYGLKDIRQPWQFKGGERRPEAIEFDNDGVLYFLGMSEEGRKVRGLAADVVLYGQIEAEENDHAFREIVGTQAGGRRGNLKRNGKDTFLFVGDCNPASKKHWWYRAREEEIDGWWSIKHEDHPLFYDWQTYQWTEKGIQTRNDLERLYPPGPWYDRMVEGLWVISEGGCFDQFDESRHVVPMTKDDFGVETTWRVSVDFGNTTAFGLYGEDTNGVNRLFKEYYRFDPNPNRITETIEHWANTYADYHFSRDRIHKLITDIETGNRAILKESGYYPQVANKEVPVTEGIQMLQKAFRDDTFFINAESLDEPEPLFEGKIQCLVDELPEIHYPPEDKQRGTKNDDKPDPSCVRHAADHARYCEVDRYKHIELPLRIGEVLKTNNKRPPALI